ncbi:MAG: hypothetical protein WBV70_04020, partial [Candidatus Bathyarchaeia archaeon]
SSSLYARSLTLCHWQDICKQLHANCDLTKCESLVIKGDAEKQAILGSRTIKRKHKKTSVYVQKTVPTLKAGVKLSDIVAEQATSSRSWPRSSGARSLSILTFHQRCVDLRFVMLHKHLMPCLSKVMG